MIENKNDKRNNTLDLLRGFAILIVVAGHAIQANLKSGGDCFVWSKLILAFQMPLLFFISGYSAGYSFPSRNSKRFIYNKIFRLLVPYFGWETIHYLIISLLPNNYMSFNAEAFLQEIFISDFWFLRMLFLFFVVVWLCDIIWNRLKKMKTELTAVILLAAASVCIVCFKRIPLIAQSSSLWYYLWFVAGYAVFHILKQPNINKVWRNSFFRRGAAIFSVILMGTVAFVLFMKSVPDRIVTVVFCFGICIVICALEKNIPEKMKACLTEIGRNTLPVYAIHWCLLFSPLWRMGFYTSIFTYLPLSISSLITAFVWLVFCLFLIKVFRMNKITRFVLLGERTK